MICDGSRFSCLTLSKTTVWVYWWKGNAKIKHKLGRVCSKKTFSALLYNFSAMLFKVEELNVPMYSVDMAECPAQPRLPTVRETEACFYSSRSSEHSQKANGRPWQTVTQIVKCFMKREGESARKQRNTHICWMCQAVQGFWVEVRDPARRFD